VADGNAAYLTFPAEDAARVVIERAGGAAYDVQVNLSPFPIRVGRRYTVRFQARADSQRPAGVGVAEAHAPWMGLGWYSRIELSPEWRDFDAEFVAAADDDRTRVHFDLAESPVSVELREVGLYEESGQPAGADLPEPSSAAELGDLRRLTPISRVWGLDRGLPVDRHYIEAFLARHAEAIRGRVLEIEDRIYTRQFGGARVTVSDILHVSPGNPRATLVGDLAHAPNLPSGAFDAILCTQTLQLVFDTRAALGTLHRMLRPGGVLLATFPGLSKVSTQEWPGSWYWGFTTASARRLFEDTFGAGRVEVEAYGNVLTAVAFLHGLAAEELTPDELAHCDPEYEVLVAVRATKAEDPP
jgi:hypothetical protein